MTSTAYVQRAYGLWERLSPFARRYWLDLLILVGIGISLAVAVVEQGTADGPEGPRWFDVPASIVYLLPLFARRRYPFAAPALTLVLLTGISFVDAGLIAEEFVMFLTAIACTGLFGMLEDRREAVAGLALIVGVSAVIAYNDPTTGLDGYLGGLVIFGMAWAVGFGLGHKFRETDAARERAEQAERVREEEARAAVAEERARVARELHDIVGHSVSVMTVQAAGVRSLLRPDQERAREAVAIVEQTGREALAEMRRLVGVLRRPEESPALAPQPSLEHVERLVAQAREAGLPVQLRVEGEPVPLAAGLDLTAYRLVQEGLTNALKHAGAARAEVIVRYDDGHVELTVSDDGTGDGGGESGGHGLVGMRERVSVYGGELEAGRRPEGGYRLHARLPLN